MLSLFLFDVERKFIFCSDASFFPISTAVFADKSEGIPPPLSTLAGLYDFLGPARFDDRW